MMEQAVLQAATESGLSEGAILGAVFFILASQIILKVFEMAIDSKRHKEGAGADCKAGKLVDPVAGIHKTICDDVRPQVDHLVGMHNVRDSDGRLVWWSDPELRKAVKANVEVSENLVKATEAMIAAVKDNTTAVVDLTNERKRTN